MDRIDAASGWTSEGLGIAIRMRHGDLAPASRAPYFLRWAAVFLGVSLLVVLASIAGWLAWRALARRSQETATQDHTARA